MVRVYMSRCVCVCVCHSLYSLRDPHCRRVSREEHKCQTQQSTVWSCGPIEGTLVRDASTTSEGLCQGAPVVRSCRHLVGLDLDMSRWTSMDVLTRKKSLTSTRLMDGRTTPVLLLWRRIVDDLKKVTTFLSLSKGPPRFCPLQSLPCGVPRLYHRRRDLEVQNRVEISHWSSVRLSMNYW